MKNWLTAIAAGSLALGSVTAHAATRPEPTELEKPVVADLGTNPVVDDSLLLVLLGLGGLLGILLAAGGGNDGITGGNSPR